MQIPMQYLDYYLIAHSISTVLPNVYSALKRIVQVRNRPKIMGVLIHNLGPFRTLLIKVELELITIMASAI